MDPDRRLYTLRLALDFARLRRRQRWKVKVRRAMYREEMMVARLEWFLAVVALYPSGVSDGR